MKGKLLPPSVIPVLLSLGSVLLSGERTCAADPPAKLLVGTWQDVHAGSETLRFDVTGRMESTSGFGKYAGVYTLVGGKTLDYSLTLPQGVRKNKMVVAYITANDLILQSPTTKAHTIYKKFVAGKAPPMTDLKKFPKLLAGRWKQAGPPPETVEFDGKGKMDILAPKPMVGSYSLSGDVLEMSLATDTGVRKFKGTVVSVSATELLMIYPNNKLSVYKRQ